MLLLTGNYMMMSLVLLGFTFLLDSHLRYVEAQTTASTALTAQVFTDLMVGSTKVWVILAAVGGVVGGIIILLLILVCCAFARRGSKVGPPGGESGSAGHYILDPARFPSVETQTDYHPGFAPLNPKVDRATMTKRSMWSGVPQSNETAAPNEEGEGEGRQLEQEHLQTERRDASF